jgi:hypothetical protein
VALAETLFRDGKALMRAGKYEEACPKLAESNRVDPATGTVLALAVCHERQGKTATAWAEYNEVAATAARQGNAERGRVARERVAELEPRLSRLSVVVRPEVANLPGLRITRDGAPLGEPSWGIAVPMDPGEHVLEVTADHKRTLSRNVRVEPHGDQQTVTLSALEDDVAPPPPPPRPSPPLPEEGSPTSTNGPVPVESRTAGGPVARPISWITYVAAGVAGAALASSSYFGLTGRSEYFALKSTCGPYCSTSAVAAPHTKLVVADISLSISILALGASAYSFFARPYAKAPPARATANALQVDIRAGTRTAGASIALAF